MPDPKLPAVLRRRLGLPLLVLYGTGITIGAGIYVSIGAVASHATVYAPWSFVFAAAVMALTVASYAELSTRFPVSAGEAVYIRAAFRSRLLSTLTGLLTIIIGVVSSAAVTRRGRVHWAIRRSAAKRHCGGRGCHLRRGGRVGHPRIRADCGPVRIG
jgi:hypothetical protein